MMEKQEFCPDSQPNLTVPDKNRELSASLATEYAFKAITRIKRVQNGWEIYYLEADS